MGALTSKTYAFTARVWENRSIETVDFLNSFCSSVIVESRGLNVMRILPKYSKDFYSWLPDRIRVIYDSLNYNKVSIPYIRNNKVFINISWKSAFNLLLIATFFLNSKAFTSLKSEFSINYLVYNHKIYIRKLLRNFGSQIFNNSNSRIYIK
jgi:NADH dehydrogenase/NADH:ubiquinone oxidoreductase subunit G